MNTTGIEPFLTEEQTRVASLVHLATAPLSVWGSGFIIYSIWKERKKKMRRVYQRLMLGLSMMDLISSLSLVLTMPWLAPAELGNELVFQAYGNFTSCAISAFFYNFMQGTACYTLCLSVFFLTQVRYEMREEKFAKCLEPASHAFSILAPLVLGILGALGEILNPNTGIPGMCWIQEFPTGCTEDEDIACIRGEKAQGINKVNGLLWVASFAVIVLCMLLIICKVGATEKRLRRYGQGTQRSMTRTKQTGRRALMYIGAYFSWFFPFIALNQVQHFSQVKYGERKYFIVVLALRIITPLQGFFNALIYRRRIGGAERTSTSVVASQVNNSRISVSRLRQPKLFSKSSDEQSNDQFAISEASSAFPRSEDSVPQEELSHAADKNEDNQDGGRHRRIDMTGSVDLSIDDTNQVTEVSDDLKEEEGDAASEKK